MREVKVKDGIIVYEKDIFNNILKSFTSKNGKITLEVNKSYFAEDKKAFVFKGDGVQEELESQINPLSLKECVFDTNKVNVFFLNKLDIFFKNKNYIFNNKTEKEACEAFMRIADLNFKNHSYVKMEEFDFINKKLFQRLKRGAFAKRVG